MLARTDKEIVESIQATCELLNSYMEEAYNNKIGFDIRLHDGITAGMQLDAPYLSLDNFTKKLS